MSRLFPTQQEEESYLAGLTGDNGRVAAMEPPAEGEGFHAHAIRQRIADVPSEAVTWLWPGRIPAGKLTMWVGDPGTGKSFATLDVAARVSSGTSWPDSRTEAVEAQNVVILSAEDDIGDTIRPRLEAAHADLTKIEAITGVQTSPDGMRYFNLTDHLSLLEDAIADTGARLCVIDPVSAYAGKLDGHSNTDVRAMLAPLSDMAARYRCAFLCVTHMNKSNQNRAIYRAMGSLAWTAAARMAWLICKDNDDEQRRLMLPLKSNLIEQPSGIAFAIVDGVVHWDTAAVDLDADEVLAMDTNDKRERQEAEGWLLEYLATGPAPSTEVRTAAEAYGHAWGTMRRAQKAIGVKVTRVGFGKGGRYTWELPATHEPIGAHGPCNNG